MIDCDLIIGSGDLNARTKDLKDFLPEIDGDLPNRSNPDLTKNAHGNNFITFLKDNRAIILNGRVTPELNNYTFVSTRGSSVPDYMFCPLEHYQYCTEMKVTLIRDLVNSLAIPPPPSLPDHSILTATFTTSYFDFPQSVQSSFEPFNNIKENPQKKAQRKNLKKIDQTFLMGENNRQLVLNTIAIDRLENVVKNQRNVDELWKGIKDLFINEMENLPNIPSIKNKKLKKTFRKAQPFWNNELGNLWNLTCQAEKNYLNFVVTCQDKLPHKKHLQQEFKAAQSLFDKKFRYCKRKYNDKNQNDLLNLATENDPNIWDKIRKLNSPPTRPPLEIVREDETISNDLKEILERWHHDISRLFSGLRENPEMAFNEAFYNEILTKKEEFENMTELNQQQFSNFEFSSDTLNSDITFAEVSKAID